MSSELQGRIGGAGPEIWCPPPISLPLPDDQVHVWRINLDLQPITIDSLWRILSNDEQARADRYRFARDRSWFVARRGRLRLILAEYLGLEPAGLEFSYNHFGKPALRDEAQSKITFNISHSHGLALFAFARRVDIGVDLENRRENIDYLGLAERFFSSAEIEQLHSLSPALRPQAFFLCWTRKEAFIKASGEGLSLPLANFDVSLDPGEPARLLATRHGLDAAGQMEPFQPRAGARLFSGAGRSWSRLRAPLLGRRKYLNPVIDGVEWAV